MTFNKIKAKLKTYPSWVREVKHIHRLVGNVLIPVVGSRGRKRYWEPVMELSDAMHVSSQRALRRDVLLIFENCFLYNPETPDRRNFEVSLAFQVKVCTVVTEREWDLFNHRMLIDYDWRH